MVKKKKKNTPANAGDKGVNPDPGRSHVLGSNYARAPQLRSLCSRTGGPRLLKSAHPGAHALQQEKPPE